MNFLKERAMKTCAFHIMLTPKNLEHNGLAGLLADSRALAEAVAIKYYEFDLGDLHNFKSKTFEENGYTHVLARWEDPVPATVRATRGWEWSAFSS